MTTVADHVLTRLRAWGVEHVFGYPGDGVNGLLAAWGRASDAPRFVQARHEEMAAFEACGYARLSGRTGVCVATSGPGAIHLLNGLYDAKLDHVPVVAVLGQSPRRAIGSSYQQEVDLPALFEDVAEYCVTVSVPEQLPNALDRAMRVAASRRTVAAVVLPSDVQDLEYVAPAHAQGMAPSSLDLTLPAPVPPAEDLVRAAEVLSAGTKVAVLVGQGARGAAEEVTELAEVLGAGVATALLGKDVLDDREPWVTGCIGLLGTRPSWDLMQECDTLLVVGSSFPYSEYLPPYDEDGAAARAVQIDIDGSVVGMRYPFEVNLVGDAKASLAALLPMLRRQEDRSWRAGVEDATRRWWDVMTARAAAPAEPVNPELVLSTLSPLLPDDAVVTADSGSGTDWYARHVRLRGSMRGMLSGTLATMGCAVPHAIGAKIADPTRPVVAVVGDGAMQMNGLAELATVARYWQEWEDPRLVVCVLDNRDLNQVTWELRALGGAPQFEPSQTLPPVDYAGFALGLGLHAATVDDPDEVEDVWREALRTERPSVLVFRTDGSVPPVPPHATWDQMTNTARSLVHDPHRREVAERGIRSKLAEILPGGGRD